MFSINIEKIKTKHGCLNFLSSDLYIGKSLKQYGEYSEIELSILLSLINKKDVVFDIGSNIGAFTIPIAKKVGKLGTVFSFEPQNLIHEIQKENIDENNIKNIKLYQAGISDKPSQVKLCLIDYSMEDNFGGVSLIQSNLNPFYPENNDPKQQINMITLDSFLFLKKCNFIKIDVENMEINVLRGGRKFLEKFRPILWMENHRIFPNKVNKFLLDREYDIYWVLSTLYNPKNFFRSGLNLFPNICSENILAIPKEKKISKLKYFDNCEKIIDCNTPPKKIFDKFVV